MEESLWNSDASSETGERKTKRPPSQKTEEFPVKKEKNLWPENFYQKFMTLKYGEYLL
jgi:hypothetical protein